MSSDTRIWNFAKWRFLQGEASLWLIGNKCLECLFIVGIIMLFYFDNFKFCKYLGIAISIFSAGVIRYRFGLYEGYFDGYEQGFTDAATRNCDYWKKTDDITPEDMAINNALKEIEKNEEKINEKNKIARADEIKKGFAKLLGWFLTWRKINIP